MDDVKPSDFIPDMTEKEIFDIMVESRYPIIVVGADGTGKTTLIEDVKRFDPLKHSFKYSRDNAQKWLDSEVGLEEDYDIFDRHPVIDWPVYESVRQRDTCSEKAYRKRVKLWLSLPKVTETLRCKLIVWLRNRHIEAKEGRDLDFVIGQQDYIDHQYEIFFQHLMMVKAFGWGFNTTEIIRERIDE